jgi:hypothetical protein
VLPLLELVELVAAVEMANSCVTYGAGAGAALLDIPELVVLAAQGEVSQTRVGLHQQVPAAVAEEGLLLTHPT